MNQKDLILTLYQEYGLPKYFADKIIKTILTSISTELKKGNRVRLRNFGTFEMRKSHGKLRPKFNPSKNLFKIFT